MTNGFTPLTPVSGFTENQLFQDDLGSLLQQLEGPKPLPYADTHGIATVGIGLNLTVPENRAAYFAVLGISQTEQAVLTTLFSEPWPGASGTTDLQNAIVANGITLSSIQLSDANIETLWNDLVIGDVNGNNPSGTPAYLPAFKQYMADHNVSPEILSSQDGLAIFSLYYNNQGTLIPPGSKLLGDLNTNDFDRPDAWFQIRFGSNGGSSPSGGIAKRRYEESRIFGLYDYGTDTSPDLIEAQAIYAELSANTNGHGMSNRQWAFQYEDTWQSHISDANADLGALQPMQPSETVQIQGLTVPYLDQLLQPAFNTLWNQYIQDATLNPFAQFYTGNTVSPLDMQVAQLWGGSDLVASQRDGYQLGQGGDLPSVLIAQYGKDTLDGSGSANDALIGYSAVSPAGFPGDDTFIVGDGDDYIVAGTGSAEIGGLVPSAGIGSGNDTIVLGDPLHAHSYGVDTVWGGAGDDVYYLAPGDSDVIHLGLGQSTINLVNADGSVSPLDIDATELPGAMGTFFDPNKNALLLETQNPDGSESVKIIGLGSASSSQQDLVTQEKSLSSSSEGLAAEVDSLSLSGGVLELDNFQGDSDAGVTLNSGDTTTPGASNLGNFSATTYSDHTEYQDFSGMGGGDSMYGANTTGGNYNILEGEGNASYIYAGDGNNEAFANDSRYSTVDEVFTYPLSVVIQGGSGDQLLVGAGVVNGVADGQETIIGGAMGEDTAAWTTIDGGGINVDALLVGGSQNSLILGGLGTDTILASSGAADSSQPDPQTIVLAGLSFWASSAQVEQGGGSEVVTGEPQVSFPGSSDAANFQVEIALSELVGDPGVVNGPLSPPIFGTPFGLLGSEWDSGTDTSPWKYPDGTPITLPGSLMIGGDGEDLLIGNSGNDTIIGGTPANPQTGVIDEVLVGAGGTNVIYGGGGNEWIYADLSPGADANWADLNPADADTIYGGTGNEYIYGSGGNDVIHGGAGNYTIYTGNGDAYVEAGSGNTIVNGGSGDDTIIAGSGTDSITTGDGDDSVYSGDGQSTISIGAGTDTLVAGSGTTTYNAGTGVETYQVGLGTGNQTVVGGSSASSIDVTYTNGITSADVVARCDTEDNLILTNQATGSQFEIDGYFDGESNVSVSFSDGVTWDAGQILQASMTPDYGDDLLVGSDGNDTITGGLGDDTIIGVKGDNVLTGGTGNSTIYGGSGSDTIEGGAGSNELYGGTGLETYLFNIGDGSDTITENTTAAGTDLLNFGAGITRPDVTFSKAGSGDLLITFDTISNSTIDVPDFFASGDSQHQIETFQFADGTSLTREQLMGWLTPIVGTSGNEILNGTSGSDYFDGKGGNDTENGDGGNDTFVFNPGYGDLAINEPYTSGQQPVLQLGPGITESSLHATTNGNTLWLTDGVTGDQITLSYMWSNDNYGVTSVQFADGTKMTRSQLMQMAMIGTTGSDTIYGTSGADLIDGKGGYDLVIGRGGNDTFVFNPGYGYLEINEYYGNSQPVLQLGAGITTSTLHASMSGYGDLWLMDGISGDEIKLDAMVNPDTGVAVVQLADGTTLTRSQLKQMAMTGAPGNDTINGTSDADLIDGQGGNDVIYGNGGSDTFVFNSGYGDLQINESYGSEQQPVLQFGAGITTSSLHATTNGVNLILTDGVSGDQITLERMWSISSEGVAVAKLADGTILTRNQLIQMETTGIPGSDTLYGTSGADCFDGRGGGDVEYGDGGSDTFVFNSGYGELEVSENYATSAQPVLQMGAGITISSLQVSGDDRGDLILTDGVSGDQVTLDYLLEGNPGYEHGVAAVELADGTTLSEAQLVQMETTGTSGSDTLYGSSAADHFDGKGGDDVEYGSGGSDTFVFNPGYGHLAISSAGSGSSLLKLGAGITSTELSVTENEEGDLIVTDGIAGDQITLSSFVSSNVQSVQFADGSTLSRDQIAQMASNLDGTTGSDYLVGTAGGDVIDGMGGNDIELGNGGNDTFVFNQGYGALEVGQEDGYTIRLGPGITSSDVGPYESNSHDGDDLILAVRSAGVIRLDGVYFSSGSNVVEFSDGSTISVAELASDVRYYYSQPEGGETYRLGSNSVDESVHDALIASRIDVYYEDGITSTAVLARGNLAGDLTLTNKATGSVFRLTNYFGIPNETTELPPNVYVHFSDGVTWGSAQILQQYVTPDDGNDYLIGSNGSDTITGGPGNDTIVGVKGNNVLTGGTGNSTIYGGSGADTIEGGSGTNALYGGTGVETYLFNLGDGPDTITENAYAAGTDVLEFGSGISASDVVFSLDGSNDLVVTFGAASASTIDVDNFTATGDSLHEIGTFQFADGTVYTRSQVLQMASPPNLAGTAGDDLLVGTGGADVFDGTGGNDTAVGYAGNDTFVFDAGYGDLEINEGYVSGQQPVLQLGAGIATSALQVSADGNNLVLTDGVSGDRITLDNENVSDNDGVALVQLADGTTLSAAQLFQMSRAINGTTGDDTLTGTSEADLIDGKGGNDSVIGSGGNDTFLFDSGYGDLEINESYAVGEQPVLQLGAGITASALHVSTDGTNLSLTDGITGDEIQLDGMWYGARKGVASVLLTGGTTLTASQLRQMEMTGTTGNDTLYGTSGADLIDGRGGSYDFAIGDLGNDTFVFDAGYGGLEIMEDSFGDEPVLQMGAGITESMLQVSAAGDSLVLRDGIAGDWVELDDEGQPDGLGGTLGVAIVQLADGTTLSAAQLIQMSQAMAAPAASGIDTTNHIGLTDRAASHSIQPDGQFTHGDTGVSEASRDDSEMSTSLRAPDLISGNLPSSLEAVAVGAGDLRLPGTMPSIISSAGGRLGSGLQQSHGASYAGAHAGRPPISDTQSASRPGAEAGMQPSPDSNDIGQHRNTLPPISVLDTHLGSYSSLAQAHPEADIPTPGAPADPLMNDPDDLRAQSDFPLAIGGRNDAAPGAASAEGWKSAFEPTFGRPQAMHTAGAVDSMVKALAAQGGMGVSTPWLDLSAESPDQIRLQGGAAWSLSAVDRTLAALGPVAGAAGDPSSRLTDLAHAQLIGAMASFSPAASAESSSLLSPRSENYAIAVAASMQ